MNILLTNLYIFILAMVLAILEIQIEGEAGWAKDLPTWRPKGTWYVKFYEKLMSGREFTGYHLTMFTLVFLIFHLPYVFGLPFNLTDELRTLSFFFIFVILWDFLWFVLNPHYPLSKFKKEHIWWHKSWFLGAPVDYYGGIILSLLIVTIPTLFTFPLSLITNFIWWISNILLFAFFTFSLTLFTLYVLKIDHWSKT
jgi:hypothetical protein